MRLLDLRDWVRVLCFIKSIKHTPVVHIEWNIPKRKKKQYHNIERMKVECEHENEYRKTIEAEASPPISKRDRMRLTVKRI